VDTPAPPHLANGMMDSWQEAAEDRGDRLTGRAETGGPGRSYALLADGTTLTIRPPGPEDYEAVKRLHEAMSPENPYYRFFSASRVSAEREARRVCLDDHPGMVALLPSAPAAATSRPARRPAANA